MVMIRRLTHLSLAILYFLAQRSLTAITRFFGKQPDVMLVTLLYHGVTKEERSRFARQLDELLRLTHPVSVDTHEPLKRGRRYAAVTFDDGLRSTLENALPELRARGIPATVFIPTGYLGQRPEWKGMEEDGALDDSVMTAEQVGEISRSGAAAGSLFTIGSHTVTHADLTCLSGEDLRRELVQSKGQLEDLLGSDVDLFAFPYGEHSDEVCEAAKQAGYRKIFADLPESAVTTRRGFLYGRVFVSPSDWPVEYRLKLIGAYQWWPTAVKMKRRLRHTIRVMQFRRSNYRYN